MWLRRWRAVHCMTGAINRLAAPPTSGQRHVQWDKSCRRGLEVTIDPDTEAGATLAGVSLPGVVVGDRNVPPW